MPNWTTPVSPADDIMRRPYWQTSIDDITALNDIIGHPNGGHVSLTDGGPLIGNGEGAIVAMAVLAKGSIIAGDGATDPIAVTVGSNDQVLRADSSQAAGVVWETVGWDVAEAFMYGE